MGSNGVDHPLKQPEEEGVSSQGHSKNFKQAIDIYESVAMVYQSSNEQLYAGSFRKAEPRKTNSVGRSSVLEIFQSKEINVGSSPRRG